MSVSSSDCYDLSEEAITTSFGLRGSASSLGARRATTASKATSASTASTTHDHHLHHLGDLIHGVASASASTSAYARDVLSLGDNSNLAAFEKRIAVKLRFHSSILRIEFNISITIQQIVSITTPLPFGLVCELVNRDGNSLNFSAVVKVVNEFLRSGAEVYVLDENGPLIRIVS